MTLCQPALTILAQPCSYSSDGHGSQSSDDTVVAVSLHRSWQPKDMPRVNSDFVHTAELKPSAVSASVPCSPNVLIRPTEHSSAVKDTEIRFNSCRRSHSDSELSALHRRFPMCRMPQRQIWSSDVDSCIECLTLSDFGYSNNASASGSSFACTEPFQMLTEDACHFLRSEIFASHTKEFLDDKLDHAAYFSHDSPFIRDLETSQKFEDLMNRLVDVPVVASGTSHLLLRGPGARSAVDWHRDESTLCCVILLSKIPANAEGGETLLRRRDGGEFCLRFPEGGIGQAYLMQGSHFEHRFEPACNFECLTLTVWLRPADGWGADEFHFDTPGFVEWE